MSADPPFIPLCEPHLGGNEWSYVKDCLDTGWVSSVGAYVDRFESMMATYTGSHRAIACVNGTAALHIALLVAGVKAGDEVLVSTLTFIAPANAIRYTGAVPVLVDADPVHWQMDVTRVDDFLRQQCERRAEGVFNRKTGRPVRAIMPVHILGHPVDMAPLLKLAAEFELRVIEDATESLGSTAYGRASGSVGDLGCFSFNGNKLLTTGGGGMIISNYEDFANVAKHLTTQAKAEPVEFIHDQIGYNYRLTNVAAALGCAQLERIEHHLQRKRQIADVYRAALGNHPCVTTQVEASWARSAMWLFTLRLRHPNGRSLSRAALKVLAAQRIQTRPLWQPIHRSPAHMDLHSYRCPVADQLYDDCLSLPCSVGLQPEQQERVISALTRFLDQTDA